MFKSIQYIYLRVTAFFQSVGVLMLFGLDDASIMLDALKRHKQKKLCELKARRRYLKHCTREIKDHAGRHRTH